MEMELNKETLKNQRDRRAWSQTQLAEVSGLSLRTIQRIEKTGVASQESAKSLASVYECSISELVFTDAAVQVKSKLALNNMSAKAKLIHLCVLVPVLAVAVYLFFTDHYFVSWVDTLRDSIFSSTISQQRLDKISFLILVVSVGLPCLLPGYVYDLLNRPSMKG